MSGRAEGRKAFVTGASGGLGRGIARLFLEEGAMVALADLRGAEDARESLGGNGRSTAVQLDVRDPASVEAAISEAWDVFGGLDILVNCAGVYPSDLLVDMSVDAWDSVLDTNLKGPFLCSRAMVSRWIEQGIKGHIVNITSGAALRARPGAAHYCTSKAALEMLTRAFALEMAPHHIHVNAVSPGFFDVSSDVNQISRDYVDALVKTIPWGEGGKPSDIAEAVLFLCSDAASYISGTSLRVDGAYSTGTNALPVSRPGKT
ncbi:MAG TPA: SDR family oxidoreductase [Candidatus Dormibacteraeota bacterium]|jgi:NAD(P)-dependent dehydrogenase (short-subunit alcohol dehydrogenase family)